LLRGKNAVVKSEAVDTRVSTESGADGVISLDSCLKVDEEMQLRSKHRPTAVLPFSVQTKAAYSSTDATLGV
jgi:hypothetical protein